MTKHRSRDQEMRSAWPSRNARGCRETHFSTRTTSMEKYPFSSHPLLCSYHLRHIWISVNPHQIQTGPSSLNSSSCFYLIPPTSPTFNVLPSSQFPPLATPTLEHAGQYHALRDCVVRSYPSPPLPLHSHITPTPSHPIQSNNSTRTLAVVESLFVYLGRGSGVKPW